MKYHRIRIYVLIFLGLFIFYFTGDFTIINIEKTALIVALGIDANVDSGFTVTAQIAVPTATDQGGANNESVIVSSGETLYEAVERIGTQTGWYPKLSFCNVIILGESALKENALNYIDFFIRSYKIEDSAVLCAAEGSAKEILLSKSPLDNVSSFALIKILIRDSTSASSVYPTTLKDFTSGYYSRSRFGFMPYLRIVKTQDKADDKSGGSESASSGLSGSSSGSDGGGTDKQNSDGTVVFDASSLLLFDGGIKAGKFDEYQTLFYSLLYKSTTEAYFKVDSVDDDGNVGVFLMAITDSKCKKKLCFDGEKFTYKITLDLYLKIADSNDNQTISTISNLGKLNDKTIDAAQNYAAGVLDSLFDTAKIGAVDVFNLKNELYRFYPKKYDDNYAKIVSDVTPEITVRAHNFS